MADLFADDVIYLVLKNAHHKGRCQVVLSEAKQIQAIRSNKRAFAMILNPPEKHRVLHEMLHEL